MSASATVNAPLETFTYDNKSVAWFAFFAVLWGAVGMLVGVIIALQLSGLGTIWGPDFLNQEWLGFGRLRPLHTNAVIFGFTGNAIFAGSYYALQRVLKTRLWSDTLTWTTVVGWQLIIVAAALTLPFGINTSKEYAELEWPIDLAITIVWLAWGINMIATILVRRERHLYVAVWFFLSTFLAVAMLHVVNSLAAPVSWTKSYSLFAGAQDALVQWWYGHNAVAFFLTTPLLGLMYYFLPKAANRPIFSYRLSIVHFWSLVFIYIWAGPHHLLHSSLPEWAQTLGVVFSIALWAPSWGGMVNGLLTLRGAFDKVRSDPVLQFFVIALTFYGMSTFEGPLLSLRSVNALSHNSDWTVAHVHSGALGWVGYIVFGMLYWLVPKLFGRDLWSVGMAKAHFWLGFLGLLLYIGSMWAAGLMQGLSLFAFTDDGRLAVSAWIDILERTFWLNHIRSVGGVLYLLGMLLALVNLALTAKTGKLVTDTAQAPALTADEPTEKVIADALSKKKPIDRIYGLHDLVERWPLLLTALTLLSLSIGGAFQIIPNLIQGALSPEMPGVKPYSALELAGRDIYIAEGCNGCHTQMVRTLRADTARFGDNQLGFPAYSRAGEDIYDRPHLWSSKRTGPDLDREGLIRPDPFWHYQHFYDARAMTGLEGSTMPGYPHLFSKQTDYGSLPEKMRVLAAPPLNTPYTSEDITGAIADAKAHAEAVVARINGIYQSLPPETQASLPPPDADARVIALIAYMQKLGRDIKEGAAK